MGFPQTHGADLPLCGSWTPSWTVGSGGMGQCPHFFCFFPSRASSFCFYNWTCHKIDIVTSSSLVRTQTLLNCKIPGKIILRIEGQLQGERLPDRQQPQERHLRFKPVPESLRSTLKKEVNGLDFLKKKITMTTTMTNITLI